MVADALAAGTVQCICCDPSDDICGRRPLQHRRQLWARCCMCTECPRQGNWILIPGMRPRPWRTAASISQSAISDWYYQTYGSGRPVLVLHGGTGSLVDMRYQVQALAKKHFVIAPDSRGQGRSSDDDAPLGYRRMADDMLRLLDHLGIDRADIVGWSDGGIIALDLAMRHPERVRRLVVIGANFDVDGLKSRPAMPTTIPPPPDYYQRNAPDPAHWPVLYRKVVTMWRTEPHYTLRELGSISAPTLVMAGESDVIRREHTDLLAKSIPGGREAIIAGATHAAALEKPDVLNADILGFLDAPPL